MSLMKPCIEPRCGRVTRGTRCPEHERARAQVVEHRRGTREARGYGYQWRKTAAFVLERDGHVCRYCGSTATTVDHVIPKARGGSDDPGNLVACCATCNSAKGARV